LETARKFQDGAQFRRRKMARVKCSDVMKLAITLIFAFLPTTVVYAQILNYSCNACLFPKIVTNDGFDGCDIVEGKSYPLRVDENKTSSNGGVRATN
jgi:hypothetical protein